MIVIVVEKSGQVLNVLPFQQLRQIMKETIQLYYCHLLLILLESLVISENKNLKEYIWTKTPATMINVVIIFKFNCKFQHFHGVSLIRLTSICLSIRTFQIFANALSSSIHPPKQNIRADKFKSSFFAAFSSS